LISHVLRLCEGSSREIIRPCPISVKFICCQKQIRYV
jgi:hypothetical protein